MEGKKLVDVNEADRKARFNKLLGAAFLTATTAIGPGFCTQTALFGGQYLGSFFFIILAVLVLDVATQANTYRLCCYTGKRGQDIANTLMPGLGYVLSGLVMFGIFIFQLGNVGGTALGVRTLLGLDNFPHWISILIAGFLAIMLFVFQNFNKVIDRIAQIMGAILLLTTIYIAFISKPPVGNILPQFLAADKASLIYPFVTVLGGSCGGYISLIGPHRLVGSGIYGAESYGDYKRTLGTQLGVTYVVRLMIYMTAFAVVSAGAILDPTDPARSAFEAGAGILGRYLFGIVIFTAGITTVVGAAVTLVSMVSTYSEFFAKNERYICIGFIAIATAIMAFIGQPAAMLVAAGSINGLILPLVLIIMMASSRSKRVMGADYTHPVFLTVGAIAVILISGYFGIINFPKILSIFA